MDDIDIDLGVLIHEPEELYHSKADEYLGSHSLADFRRCPLLHFKDCMGLIPDFDRSAYLIGRAGHCRILEGRDPFSRRYAVGGPINPKTGKPFGSNTNAFAEWAAAQGRPVLTPEQAQLIENMAVGVAMSDRAVDLIVDGVAEGVVRADYGGVPCQIRIDWLNPHRGIVDLKTCDDLTYFESDARRYGYAYQMAFYRAVLAEVIQESVPVHFIAIEKKEPFRCGVWRVSEDTLAQCARENAAAIGRLKECRRLGAWPTGYEEVRVFDAM
ncbi:MAG: PD-(D/E)XK nuclease-like domain-containing protein [Planctomycetota bacterium]|nr:PD-(D/E)XK nuclease-like domain-containing protein [Planctomycetota bacterium]